MNIEQFVSEVKILYGDDLISVILYGSQAVSDSSKSFSDYNLIMVLKEINPASLKRSSKLIKKWVKKGHSLPLFFDKHHIETSADVFPIEFFDIKAGRKILHGTDPFVEMKIDTANLRHQCESELKGKLLQLQSKYVLIADNDKQLAHLMVESLSSFLSILKGVVRLKGIDPETKKRSLVEQAAGVIDFDPNIFMALLDVRDGLSALPRKDATEKFEDYLTQIKKIANFVDQF